MNIMQRRDTCRGCGGIELDLILSLNPSPIGDAYISADKSKHPQPTYPIDLYMCRNCGLSQLIDVIDPEVLYGDYIYVTASSLGLDKHFSEYVKNVLSICDVPSYSLVMDIGSNDGTLLKHFQKQKMNVLGVEPASHIADEANSNGVQTINGFFTPDLARKILLEHGKVKIITSNNVFANIDNIIAWLEAVKIVLDDDGVYVFESFYLLDVVRNMVFDFIYHEHLTAFSVKPVKALAEKVGLELVNVQHVDTKGGSLRYFLQKENGPLKDDGSVLEYLKKENVAGLYNIDIYKVFANEINLLKNKTKEFLSNLKNTGVSIAGFGASITCTTLIYHFEIGEYIDYLIDDNPSKQGLFSPGLHLPVYSSEILSDKKPDYVIILAWRFSATLINNNKDYINNGGCFIVPIPEFQIIENT